MKLWPRIALLGLVFSLLAATFPASAQTTYTDRFSGSVIATIGKQPVVAATTPYGETVYWIGPAGSANDASSGTDFDAIEQGYVSVTPLRLDLTDQARLGQLTSWVDALCV